jgi:hypothetical protein
VGRRSRWQATPAISSGNSPALRTGLASSAPKLTILDAQMFKPKRHYGQSDFNAMVTHMRVAHDGAAYFVLTQFIAASAMTRRSRT